MPLPLLAKKLFGRKRKKSPPQFVIRNYGSFRLPDELYFLPATGKAKIVLDLYKNLSSRKLQSERDIVERE